MARAQTKTDLLTAIETEWQKLEKILEPLTEAQMTQAGVCDEWSIKDILGHLLEWEQMVLSWYQAGLRGEKPKTPAPDLTWRQTPMLNQRIYEKHQQRPLAEVRADFRSSHQQMWTTIQAIAETDLFEPGRYAWTGKLPFASYVTSSTSSHFHWAKDLIRKWLKTQS